MKVINKLLLLLNIGALGEDYSVNLFLDTVDKALRNKNTKNLA